MNSVFEYFVICNDISKVEMQLLFLPVLQRILIKCLHFCSDE